MPFVMNMEQREKQLQEIYRLEGLLKYALKHDETEEAERIRKRLAEIVESL